MQQIFIKITLNKTKLLKWFDIKKVAFKNFRSSKCEIKAEYGWKNNSVLDCFSYRNKKKTLGVKQFLHLSFTPVWSHTLPQTCPLKKNEGH